MSNRVTIDRLACWLHEREDILLIGHVSPDGDSAGSCLALWHALRAMGKRAVVFLPGGIPRLYLTLPGADEVISSAQALPFLPRTAVAVDVSGPERLGEQGLELFKGCEYQAVLDHHFTNVGFGQLYALDGEAAATGELVIPLIDALGTGMTREIAESLFVAISTDCGQFSYSNTRPQTFSAAARCAEAGIDISEITRVLYRTRTRSRTLLLGLVLSGLQTSLDGRIAWARLTEDMLQRAGALREENEGIVNYLLEIDGVEIAILAEQRGTATKFSLRSGRSANVARDIAVPLGGGGHDCAAGVTLDLPMDKALQRVLALAEKAVRN